MSISFVKEYFKKYKKWIIAGYIVKFLITATIIGFAQQPSKKFDEIQIKTSLMCKMCKERITNGLIYEKGIKDVTIDIPTKVVTVKYNTKQTSPDIIREKISKMGYDADKIAGNQKAYEKLPACCKKDAAAHD
ncbi:MAG: heavy metal-associated domain-containing protein [Bacteroidota bacterium]